MNKDKDFLKSGNLLNDVTRRHFLYTAATGIGGLALGSLLGCSTSGDKNRSILSLSDDLVRSPHFPPKAKYVITCTWQEDPHNWSCLTINLFFRN